MKYNEEELLKYKKKELISLINSICHTYNMLYDHYEEFKKTVHKEYERYEKEIDKCKEEGYNKFLDGNREYLERFMTDFIKERLFVELENSEGGYYYTQVFVGQEKGQPSSTEFFG